MEQVLKLINFGVHILSEESNGFKYSKEMEKTYKEYLKKFMLPMVPSPLPCRDWRGLLLTEENAHCVLKRSLVSECKERWLKISKCFRVTADIQEELSVTQRFQYLSKNWLDTEPDCQWWRLGMKLIRCCKREEIESINKLMTNVAKYNNSDAPFEPKYVLKALEPFSLKVLKLTEPENLEDYMMKYPNVCSWKTI
jgi:hypothetical protein